VRSACSRIEAALSYRFDAIPTILRRCSFTGAHNELVALRVLKIADVPQSSRLGGLTNSTPLAESWRQVASTSVALEGAVEERADAVFLAGGVNSTMRVALVRIESSIQRCSPIG